MNLIETHPGGWGFRESGTGRPFVPFGVNYYDPDIGWPPQLWKRFDAERAAKHFRLMAEAGVNAARVFVTYGSFVTERGEVEEAGLAKLDAMLRLGRENGIRFIFTGPEYWEGEPRFGGLNAFLDPAHLEALDRFWETVAARYAGDGAIMAFSLRNEPHIPWDYSHHWYRRRSLERAEEARRLTEQHWRSWLEETYGSDEALKEAWGSGLPEGESMESASIPPNRSAPGDGRLYDYQLFRETVAEEWVRRQVEVIHRHDPRRLVTNGLVQYSVPVKRHWAKSPSRYTGFNPRREARHLDYVSCHFYPLLPEGVRLDRYEDTALAQVKCTARYCYAGSPLVLEEFGWEGGGESKYSAEEHAAYCRRVVEETRGLVCGWLSWPFADTPKAGDCSRWGGLFTTDGRLKPWGREFKRLAEGIKGELPERSGSSEVRVVDMRASLTTYLDEGRYDEYLRDGRIDELYEEYLGEGYIDKLVEEARVSGNVPEIELRA